MAALSARRATTTMKQSKPFLAFDAINCEYEEHYTIEEARKWLVDRFLSDCEDEGYHPDLVDCKIYKLVETVGYDVVDSKENYKYESYDDVPEFENVDDADANDSDDVWPYDSAFDEIWKHKFIPFEQ